MRSRSAASGPMLVLAAAMLWGTTGTAQALGPDGISPTAVAVVRMTGGATLLLVAIVRRVTVPLRDLASASLVVAVATMAASQPLFFTGVARTGVAVGTMVTIGTGPIFVGALAWLVRRDRVSRTWLGATGVAIVGLVVLASGGQDAGVDPVGLVFAAGAGLAWAAYLVAVKSLFDHHPPLFVAAVVFALAAVVLSPGLVLTGASWIATPRGALVAVWVGLVATAASYVLFASGLGRTPVATAATLTLAEPVTATILGVLVLSESLRPSTAVGVLLIGVGLILVSRDRSPSAADAESGHRVPSRGRERP